MKRSIAYDTIAARYDETRGGLVRGASFARAFAAALGDVDGPVLDLGVGTGAVAFPLRQLGYPVVGLDLSLPMLALAHDRLGSSVAQGDGLRLPLRAASVGAVTMSWVLQLVADQAAVLAECRRVLRPSGRVVTIIAAPKDHEPNDLLDYEQRVGAAAGVDDVTTRLDQAHAAAAQSGLVPAARLDTEPERWEQTPNELADRNEQRLFGGLVHLSDADFAARIRPIIDELRALPDADRPRTFLRSYPVVVLRRR